MECGTSETRVGEDELGDGRWGGERKSARRELLHLGMAASGLVSPSSSPAAAVAAVAVK